MPFRAERVTYGQRKNAARLSGFTAILIAKYLK
ncbi:MAG: hypothetical protein ACJAVM_001255 [Sulfitobacter sp.]|jgi:hypothetical protein